MDTLTTLFGSLVKVKILRMFLFNQGTPFLLKEIIVRSKSPTPLVKKELANLVKAEIIKKRLFSKEIETKQGDKVILKKVSGMGYVLSDKFPYFEPLKNLLTVASLHADESLAKRFTHSGRIKLFVASGVFIQDWNSRVDLLIVGDELNLQKIEAVIKVIESEIGKEIAYSAFETQAFEYRHGIHDRLIRDILDYPHITLVDRIGVEPQ